MEVASYGLDQVEYKGRHTRRPDKCAIVLNLHHEGVSEVLSGAIDVKHVCLDQTIQQGIALVANI